MIRADDRSIDRGSAPAVDKGRFQFLGANVDKHGIHETRGPLMVGGVEFLGPATDIFRDLDIHDILTSKQRFQAYLQFREQAFKIAATELVAAFKSPHSIIVDDQSNESGADKNLPTAFASDSDPTMICGYKNKKESLLQRLHYTQRYFVYRKGLAKLNISQFNNDCEKALEWLKSSTGWSELTDDELRRGLKNHMEFLEEHEKSKMNQPSISESESLALERINVELASELDKKLDTSDWALPVREICKEQILPTSSAVVKLPLMKETVGQSFEGFMKETVKPSFKGSLGFLHRIQDKNRRGVAGRMALLFVPVATAVAVAMLDMRKG